LGNRAGQLAAARGRRTAVRTAGGSGRQRRPEHGAGGRRVRCAGGSPSRQQGARGRGRQPAGGGGGGALGKAGARESRGLAGADGR
jgi:hypothetical protein